MRYSRTNVYSAVYNSVVRARRSKTFPEKDKSPTLPLIGRDKMSPYILNKTNASISRRY